VIEHFQRTSAIADALTVLIDAYRALEKPELAADAQRVLDLNRQAGRLTVEAPKPAQVDLARKLWEYFSLDEH
jgi:outer membrane protein assembly factor BamD